MEFEKGIVWIKWIGGTHADYDRIDVLEVGMTVGVRPIRSEADYEAALAEVERLWGSRVGTPEGGRWM